MDKNEAKESKSIRLGRASFISLDLFLTVLAGVTGLLLVWGNLRVELAQTSVAVSDLTCAWEELKPIVKGLLSESELQSKLARAMVGEVWNCTMEERSTAKFGNILKAEHPELDLEALPNVRWIQKQYRRDE